MKIFEVEDKFYVDASDLYLALKSKCRSTKGHRHADISQLIKHKGKSYEVFEEQTVYGILQNSRKAERREVGHKLKVFLTQIRQGWIKPGFQEMRYSMDNVLTVKFGKVSLHFLWYNGELWVRHKNLEDLFKKDWLTVLQDPLFDELTTGHYVESEKLDDFPTHKWFKSSQFEALMQRSQFLGRDKMLDSWISRISGIANAAKIFDAKTASKTLKNLEFSG